MVNAAEPGEDVWHEVCQIVGKDFVAASSSSRIAQFRALVIDASVHGRKAQDPVREVLALLGDRWSTLLLQLLHYGPFRFAVLQRLVTVTIKSGISRRVLARKLQALERDGFVSRTVMPSSPPQVRYELTENGHGLWAMAAKLVDWLAAQETEIETARRAFAEHNRGGG